MMTGGREMILCHRRTCRHVIKLSLDKKVILFSVSFKSLLETLRKSPGDAGMPSAHLTLRNLLPLNPK